MLAVAVIVFRETLEAALIVSIVLAASVGIPRRGAWISAGVAAGALGACVAAMFAAAIEEAFAGVGQELLNAAILCVAVLMLGWHSIWMARHGRELAAEASAVGRQVAIGTRPLAALAVITAMAVLREGAETVLFVFGIAASAQGGPVPILGGLALGLLAGTAAGAMLYFGLLRIPVHRLFLVTGWMVLLLAAGLAAQAAGFLVQADLLPPLGQQVWDSSWVLNQESMLGRILHTLIGYIARPAGVQVIAYAATIVLIGVPMRALARFGRKAPVLIAVVLLGALIASGTSRADSGGPGNSAQATANRSTFQPALTIAR
jgi:high-affinity iron transporter